MQYSIICSSRLIGLLILMASTVHAQKYSIRHYTTNDGLVSNTVYSTLSDSKGFLWVCTDAGVSRFDGHKFTNFGLTDGLSDNEIMSVFEDSKGRIWFLAFNGSLSYYLGGKFFNPSNNMLLAKAKVNNTYLHFFEDKYHRLWFSSYSGYTMINKEQVTIFSVIDRYLGAEGIVVNNRNEGVVIVNPKNKIETKWQKTNMVVLSATGQTEYSAKYLKEERNRFCYLDDKNVLFISRKGIVKQKDTSQQLILPFIDSNFYASTRSVLLSSDNKLWITSSEKGVFCFNYNSLSAKPDMYIENEVASFVSEDAEQNIWISTMGNGLFMLPSGFANVRNYYSEPTRTEVHSVAKDKKGIIYAGTAKGTVLCLHNDSTYLLPFKAKSSFAYTRVNRILINDSNIWIGSDGYLIRYNKFAGIDEPVCIRHNFQKDHKRDTIHPFVCCKDISFYRKKILVSHGSSFCIPVGITCDTLSPNKNNEKRTYCAHYSKNGLIWYGAIDGLFSYDLQNHTAHSVGNPLLSGRINDIDETEDTVLILATYGYGLLFYKNGKILKHLNMTDGLASDICKRIFVHNNYVYVATANGANRLLFKNGTVESIKKYTVNDGLVSNNVNDIFADDSEICFGTSGGLTILNSRLDHRPVSAPSVYITQIKCKNNALNPDSIYTLNYQQNLLTFNYTSISFISPGDITYQYRLLDDQQWVATKNNTLEFPFLAPGDYNFQLRAKLPESNWSEIKSFRFTITPPFWKKAWFIALCAIVAAGSVIIVFRFRLRKAALKRDAELKVQSEIARLEQQALQAMMNPHFIFNVMNSIQHYINNNDKHEANIFLSDFASLIRMNLDISSKRFIPLDEEIQYLQLYLSLEQLRFGDRLTFSIFVDPDIDTDETMVPVMLMQPFIENALWHGILPMTGNGHLQVAVAKEKNDLVKITITDNGVGMPEKADSLNKKHESKGMKMTRQRLDLIGKMSGRSLPITISDAFPGHKNRGTKVEFSIPAGLF